MPRLLRLKDVLVAIGVRKSQLYKLIKEGSFPPPVKIGRASTWPESEVEVWIAKRVAERDDDSLSAVMAAYCRAGAS